MARDRPVSREHIQAHVDALLAEGLVERAPNPAHKRSWLIALTPRGRRVLRRMAAREQALLGALPIEIPEKDLRAAAAVLRAVRELFEGDRWADRVG